MRHTLRKHEILRGYGSFGRLYKEGKPLKSGCLRCSVVISPASASAPPHLKIGFSIRAAGAVRRNRLRRLVKESTRLNKAPLLLKLTAQGKSASMVIGMRPDDDPPGFSQIENDIKALFQEIMVRWLA